MSKKHIKKLQSGLLGSIVGIILGIVGISIINFFVKDGSLPGYFVPLFSAINVVTTLISINSMRFKRFGTFYAVGWLIGSFIFKDILSPLDYFLNIIAPVAILVLRFTLWIKKASPYKQ